MIGMMYLVLTALLALNKWLAAHDEAPLTIEGAMSRLKVELY